MGEQRVKAPLRIREDVSPDDVQIWMHLLMAGVVEPQDVHAAVLTRADA